MNGDAKNPKSAPPDFMIIGTPRSGTTLVQRLTTELRGVRLPPETHFFSLFGVSLSRDFEFPLDSQGISKALRCYKSLTPVQPLPFASEQIIARLSGRCESPVQLFGAVVRELAGSARLVGEKTPSHLRWWRPLARAAPSMRFVWVLRDPRAVVASQMKVPFGEGSTALAAARWATDQRELKVAQHHIGSRLLVLRYENVVIDPSRTRELIARHIGLTVGANNMQDPDPQIVQDWELEWKGRALNEVTDSRIQAWRTSLDTSAVTVTELICARAMRECGYHRLSDRFLDMRLQPADMVRLLKHRIGVRRRRRYMASISLSATNGQ